jgi:Fe2+ or Zn2+ uptake regulation protein
MVRQKHQTHSGHYKEKILELFTDDSSKIQSTELLRKARERRIGPNTFYKYLERLVEKGIVKRLPPDPNNKKEVYYIKNENVKLVKMSEGMIKEYTDPLLKELIKKLELTIALEVEYCNEHSPFEDEGDKRTFVNEIINEDEIKLTFGRILVEYGNKLVKSAYTIKE